MKHVRWIWRFWQPHLTWLWLLALMTLLSAAVTLAYPLVFKHIIDELQDAASKGQISDLSWKLAGMLALVGVVKSLANLYPAARAIVNSKLEMDVREHYFAEVLTKNHRFFQKLRTGDLITRLTDDIGGFPKIAWFSCSGIFRAVESFGKFAFCISFMLLLNWKLALISTLPLPIMLMIFYHLRKALGKRSLERQQIISTTTDALEAAFSGIRILKAFNGETAQAAEFNKILDKRIGVELAITRLSVGMRNMYEGIQHTGHILVIIAGGLMVIDGDMTIGTFYAFYVYQTLLLQPLLDIPNLFVTAKQAYACIDREIEIEELEPNPMRSAALDNATAAPRIESIELRAVSFCYDPGLPNAVEEVSITLRAGEKAAVVGAVGSGKTTLIKLVAGILKPSAGEVAFNGRALAHGGERQLRPRIGYIPQESNLFSETVAENVSFGRDLPHDDVRNALDMAQVLDEMERLPSGIDQVLGQRGLTVSGGQKQRLAIARALAGRPDLLLMDDVTASLDAQNEQRFWEMLESSQPDAMCLIVTHRLATARKADVIYMIEDGRLVGQGSHAELVQSCPAYRSFLTREELAEELGVG
ncbi:MAG: ABC transporter ATP-binding protein/permease [bacterium]|nr:ABC transporter ATP-binding protein/permease [bacterium]